MIEVSILLMLNNSYDKYFRGCTSYIGEVLVLFVIKYLLTYNILSGKMLTYSDFVRTCSKKIIAHVD